MNSTMIEVNTTLYNAVDELKRLGSQCGHGISVGAGCDIFLKFVTRKNLEKYDNIKTALKAMRERGNAFAEISSRSRAKIASLGKQFIRDEMTILCHGFSRVVLALLKEASKTTRFNVILTEGRPENEASAHFARCLNEEAKVPVRMILDSAIGYVMNKVDMVLLGAEAVVENGGIVNKIGTNGLTIIAKAYTTPVYVACESYKFSRIFPLSQSDIPKSQDARKRAEKNDAELKSRDFASLSKFNIPVLNPQVDYTQPEYITFLLTDLGVFTPSAVSDELIKLHQ